ncbi:hypothetical protein DENSPDRAFT_844055 [Dentipellis sp. KUC8613]|nr:hypothetical protein DENSPDRAFT_844055 [Dentipellis sp. KUC8613]
MSKDDFFKELRNLYRYGSAHGAESHSYPFHNHILMAYRAICIPPEPDSMVSCHPQGALMAFEVDGPEREHRVPDYLMTVTFDQQKNATDADYRKALLMFLWEAKPNRVDWDDDFVAEGIARMGMIRCMEQLSEQAYFAFREYAGDSVHTIVAIGPCFSHLEWKRPAFLRKQSDAGNQPVASSSGRGRGQSLLTPTEGESDQSPNSRPRKRCKTSPSGDLSGMPLPTVHYFGEHICVGDCSSFTPRFLSALQIASAQVNIKYKPSFIKFPQELERASAASIARAETLLRDMVSELERNHEAAMAEPPSPEEKFSAYTPRPTVVAQRVHMTRERKKKQNVTSLSEDPFSHRNAEAYQEPITPTPGSKFGRQTLLLSVNDNDEGGEDYSIADRSARTPESSDSRPAATPRGPRHSPRAPGEPESRSSSPGVECQQMPSQTTASSETSRSSSPDTTASSSWSEDAPAPPPSSASSQPDDSDLDALPGPAETEPSSSASRREPVPTINKPAGARLPRLWKHRSDVFRDT